MKFELVEFYPEKKALRGKRVCLGTVHIYAIDCELDLRGIAVSKHGKGMFFNFPHYSAIDSESGEKVRYPIVRWTNQKTHEEMMNFLHKEVKPEILKRLQK